MNILQLVSVTSDGQRIVTNSRKVAEVFGKEHHHVLRDIRELECSIEFRASNFGSNKIKVLNGSGEETESYDVSRDGLVFLVMGYRGEKASKMKEAYITAFNQMEEQLRNRHLTLPKDPMEMLKIAVTHWEQEKQLRLVAEQIVTHSQKSLTTSQTRNGLLTKENRQLKIALDRSEDYLTVTAAMKEYGIEGFPSSIGKRMSKLSIQMGVVIEKAKCPRFGEVKSYHKQVWSEFMKEGAY
jgi:Rha family phage regulatory protein